jgi:hypothetical protein
VSATPAPAAVIVRNCLRVVGMVIEMIIRVASADVAEPEAFEATAVPRARCAKALGSTARRRPQVPFPQSARCRLRTPSAIRATAGAASFVGRKGARIRAPGCQDLPRDADQVCDMHLATRPRVSDSRANTRRGDPRDARHVGRLGGGTTPNASAARLVAYHVPGANGSHAPGERQITIAWYDASRTAWLRQTIKKKVAPGPWF